MKVDSLKAMRHQVGKGSSQINLSSILIPVDIEGDVQMVSVQVLLDSGVDPNEIIDFLENRDEEARRG
jgi:hypothetical protein